MPSLVQTYPKQWKNYRYCWWLHHGSFLALIPAEILIGLPLSYLTGSQAFIGLVWVVAMLGGIVGSYRLKNWQCPRCGYFFHQEGGWCNIWSRRCLNCGLPKRDSPRPVNPCLYDPPAS